MSQRIMDVIEVLNGIRSAGRPFTLEHIKSVRVRALKRIASRRHVSYQTIADAYIRRLAPAVQSTAEFDKLVLAWLNGDGAPLRDALRSGMLDSDDRRLIHSLLLGKHEPS